METKKSKKGIVILAVVLVVAVVAALVVFTVTRPTGKAGDKTVVVVVDTGDGAPVTTEVYTDEEFLGPMLVAQGLASGDTGDYGLFITEAGGVTADESKGEWWCITKDGEQVMTGADETPLADGDRYELTLTTGW